MKKENDKKERKNITYLSSSAEIKFYDYNIKTIFMVHILKFSGKKTKKKTLRKHTYWNILKFHH